MNKNTAIELPKTVLSLTERAVEQIRSMWEENPEDHGRPLRVYVEQGGCSGMQYGLTFDELRDGDVAHAFDDVSVVVDPVSAEYLLGSSVDFSDDLMNGGFKVTNPRAKQSCGCGRSFEA